MNFLEHAINVICRLCESYTKHRARSRPGETELVICCLLKTLWAPNPPIQANQGRQVTYLFCLSYASNLRENGFLKPPRNVCWCMNAVQLKFFFPQECTETIPVICPSRYALTVFETPLKTTF